MTRKLFGLLSFLFIGAGVLWAGSYTVQKGDTGTLLSGRVKVPLAILEKANPGLDWKRLKVGDQLQVPERHQVQPGETLYSLSRSWGFDVATVVQFNGLASNSALKAGQVLFVPPSGSAKRPTTAAVVASPPPKAIQWPVDRKPIEEKDKLKSVTFATNGESFRSVSSGTVAYLGEFRGVGRVLLVQRSDKSVFGYGNFETANVSFGQTVQTGDVLGVSSRRANQKLFFFAFRGSEPLDVFSPKR